MIQAVLGIYCARHRFLRFRQKRQPGAGPETASPREPPCREPQRIYIVKERGTLCAQMTEGRVAAPLSHYFSAPVLEQERSAASFRPPPLPLHLDNGTHHYDLLSGVETINRDCRFSILR